MGVELGILSVVLFAWGVIKVGRDAMTAFRAPPLSHTPQARGLLVGVSAAFVAILSHAALDSNLHEPPVAILLALCAAVMVSAGHLSDNASRRVWQVRLPSRAVAAALAGLPLGAVALISLRMGLAWLPYEAGSLEMERHNYVQAAAKYRSAIEMDPGKALYHSAMAAAYYGTFERARDRQAAEAAIAELQTAIALNPRDGRLFSLLGHVSATLAAPNMDGHENAGSGSRGQAAVAAYQQAIALEPFNVFHHWSLAHVHESLGDHRRAQETMARAVEIEPNLLSARRWLAMRDLEAGRVDAAKRQYGTILATLARFRGWPREGYEARLLAVETKALAEALKRAGASL
jgi:tetratricopeptide (TPR) repeat protein